MLNQLNEIIRQFGQQQVVENNQIPNEQNEGIMQEAQNSIFDGLQKMVAQGGTQQLEGFLQNGQNLDSSDPQVQNITHNFLGNITEKFGISKETAMSLASSLIPMVLSQFSRRANDSNDNGLNLPDIISSITGGGQPQASSNDGGILGMGKAFLDKDKDGDVDFKDITGMLGK